MQQAERAFCFVANIFQKQELVLFFPLSGYLNDLFRKRFGHNFFSSTDLL